MEPLMKQLDVTNTHGTGRITMIGELEIDEHALRTHSPLLLLPVLHGHLEGDFHRCRTIVGIKDPREAFWRGPHEFTRQFYGWRIGKTQERAVRDLLKLLSQRLVK